MNQQPEKKAPPTVAQLMRFAFDNGHSEGAASEWINHNGLDQSTKQENWDRSHTKRLLEHYERFMAQQ